MKILGVFDNDGKTFDRYTVVTEYFSISPVSGKKYYDAIGMSHNPNSPQGFSQWGSCSFNSDGENKHLGKEIKFEELPEIVQEHFHMRTEEE